MHTKIHGRHHFECDSCGEVLDTDTKDWTEALRIMREQNWRARQIGNDWVHSCFGCAEPDARNTRARRAGRIP